MSQSDYLKYKKIATQIKLDMSNNMPPVFESQNYINFWLCDHKKKTIRIFIFVFILILHYNTAISLLFQ